MDSIASPRLRRLALRAGPPIAVALALLICYWLTLAPTIAERDSGELSTAVHTMGVPHPTGYPLYLIVGKLFDLLPLGEPAHRIAFFSAVAAAVAGGLICWALIAFTSSGLAGLLGGLAAGLNWWVWSQANQAEVYAFEVFTIALLLAMFAWWMDDRSPRRLNYLALASGLALTHHRTSLFFIAPLLLWAVITTRPASVRLLARTFACAVLPLLLYLWLPFRSSFHPPIDWGNTSGSLAFFYNHISGKLYLRGAFADTGANAAFQARLNAARLLVQLGPVGAALTLVGAVGLLWSRRPRPFGVSLFVSFALVVVWATFYKVLDKEVFYMPGIVVVAVWCGAGLGYVAHGVARLKLSPGLLRMAPAVGALVAVVLAGNMAAVSWKRVDRSRNYSALESAAVMLSGIPANAVVLLFGDDPNSAALYYSHVLHPRSAPLLLSANRVMADWCQPLLDPEIRQAVAQATGVPGLTRLAVLASNIRERIPSSRPFYTNIPFADPPRGYIALRDYTMLQMAPPPGIPQGADPPNAKVLLQLPDRRGAVGAVEMPSQVGRGKPFAVTAAVRWANAGPPEGDLRFVFAHSLVAAEAAKENPEAMLEEFTMVRPVPLLFAVDVPASRPGFHYRQTFNALLSHTTMAGMYQVFVQFAEEDSKTALAPAGTIQVR